MSAFKDELTGMQGRLLSVLHGGSILFIFPPFSRSCQGAVLEPHTLQALVRKKGHQADILYLNILLASLIGVDLYEQISNSPRFWMLGERLFARSAYGMPPLGKRPEVCCDEMASIDGAEGLFPSMRDDRVEFDLEKYLTVEKICSAFIENAIETIAALNYKIVWCTIGWEQTNCSVSICKGLKRLCPDIITLIGGMHCEADMARGVSSLSDAVDHVFSGEPESAFEAFLDGLSVGAPNVGRVVDCPPVRDLDTLPLGDYASFFEQVESFLGDERPKKLVVSYETSRGCWKGEKLRCVFCGLNSAERIRYRSKSPKKVAEELKELTTRYPGAVVFMVDHTPPAEYFHNLYPHLRLPEESSIRYQVVANLTLRDLVHLKAARVNRIQPGIEALSTNTLRLINKGTTTAQNLLLMRNALSVGIFCYWYLLWGLPGDRLSEYEKTLALLPLLRHLQPPDSLALVRFERFSLYVEHPEKFQIRDLRPWGVYHMVFPEEAEVRQLAFRFIGDYPSESRDHPELMREIAKEIDVWKKSWKKANLVMHELGDSFYIHDSRRIDGQIKSHLINLSEALEVMRYDNWTGSQIQRWAVQEKLGVAVDSRYVPLITASPDLLMKFEE